MALINCSECRNTVSDKAISCPHCGLPFHIATTKAYQMSELSSGVWVDMRTGLMWSRINVGQKWINENCVGVGDKFEWNEAIKACQNFNLAGFNDWKLPNLEEALTIMNPRQQGFNCPDNVLFQPDPKDRRDDCYWTSTRNNGFFSALLGTAQKCDYSSGIYGGADPTIQTFVRAVRRHM